ncbi:MAG: LysM peptidoglycan-binding domain-containing protein [Gemmatimonadaceae bacterium]
MARLRASFIASIVLAVAPVLGAQQPAAKPAAESTMPATHTVKRGDTLWDLAKTYLGDAYLWPEIYRLNTAVVEDPHWIYPGEILRLPAGSTMAAEPAEGGPARVASPNGYTVFNPKRYARTRGARENINLMAPHTAVRPGDYLVSPFVWAVGGPSPTGAVRKTAQSHIVVPTLEQRVYQSQEPIFVNLPAGADRSNGARYMTYALGPILEGLGQVVIPTGVIEVAGDAGKGDVRAVITRRFRPVLEGQGVMALDTLSPRVDVFPQAVEFGTQTSLAWMMDDPAIVQQGQYLILHATAKNGFETGDQVALFAALGTGAAGAAQVPEQVGVAQVLRVTQWGVSAILLRRTQGDLTVGMQGRISAKMP